MVPESLQQGRDPPGNARGVLPAPDEPVRPNGRPVRVPHLEIARERGPRAPERGLLSRGQRGLPHSLPGVYQWHRQAVLLRRLSRPVQAWARLADVLGVRQGSLVAAQPIASAVNSAACSPSTAGVPAASAAAAGLTAVAPAPAVAVAPALAKPSSASAEGAAVDAVTVASALSVALAISTATLGTASATLAARAASRTHCMQLSMLRRRYGKQMGPRRLRRPRLFCRVGIGTCLSSLHPGSRNSLWHWNNRRHLLLNWCEA